MAENETTNWPELVSGIFEKLTGRDAQITYEFDNVELHVPSEASSEASQAPWKINGKLRIRTSEGASEAGGQSGMGGG